VQTRSW